jgi:hypothetical protein
VHRSVVIRIGARLFIDPFRVDSRSDSMVVVVMLNDVSCGDLFFHDARWCYLTLDVLALAITRTIKVGREGWSRK